MELHSVSRQRLTKGLHRLNQSESERLVFGKLFKHAGDLIVPRPHDVASVDALDVVAHTDDLHSVHHAALFDALPHRQRGGGGRSIRDRLKKGLFKKFSRKDFSEVFFLIWKINIQIKKPNKIFSAINVTEMNFSSCNKSDLFIWPRTKAGQKCFCKGN